MNGYVNKVILVGRIGEAIKLTYFSEGNCVGQFRLATHEEYTNRNTNERVEHTEWHNIVVRNKLAEAIEKYTQKGDLIYLEGQLRNRSWQAEDGSPRYITEVVVSDMNLLPNMRAPKTATPPVAGTPTTQLSPELDANGVPF